MDRIEGKDIADIGGGRRGFKDQDAVKGVAGTVVLAAWLNGIQEELLKVIEEAGLTPDAKDWTQLSQALGLIGVPPFAWSINWMAVKAMETIVPPDKPAEGDIYLIPANAVGAWAGKTGKLAIAQSKGWIYASPRDGHGIGLPNGRLFIKQDGSYKELKFDVKDKTGKLADLDDINNAKTALARAILTKSASGAFTFLTPQTAFDGVKVPVANVEGLDLSGFAKLAVVNTFLADNNFKGALSVSRSATFESSVSTVVLTASGTTTLNGPLIVNGTARFNQRIFFVEPPEFGNATGGWQAGLSHDGNIRGKIWQDVFGGDVNDKNAGWAAWRIRNYIDKFMQDNVIQEIKTSGYWEYHGVWQGDYYTAPRVITRWMSHGNIGFIIGVRELKYRIGNEWRSPRVE